MSTQASDLPDFFKDRVVQNTALFVDEPAAFHTSNPVVFGPFYVAPWENLQLFVDSDHAAFGGVDIAADSAFTFITAEYDFATTAGIPYSDVLPVAGAWCRLRVTYMTGAGSALTSTLLAPTQNDDPYKRGQSQLYVMTGINSAVGASAAVSILASRVTSGRACLTVTSNATAWHATLLAVDSTGTDIAPLADILSGGNGILGPANCTLPPNQVRLLFINGDAVPRVFSYGLVLER